MVFMPFLQLRFVLKGVSNTAFDLLMGKAETEASQKWDGLRWLEWKTSINTSALKKSSEVLVVHVAINAQKQEVFIRRLSCC